VFTTFVGSQQSLAAISSGSDVVFCRYVKKRFFAAGSAEQLNAPLPCFIGVNKLCTLRNSGVKNH